ncbi:MAG: Gfo/Idh/MocA family oxidoreductase [Anaerolineae bacterium]|nr:Gfo/Idh/MocA family oxidoreductase [Anaerolineae bacterium]
MNQEITIALVALGGYGNFYLKDLFNIPPECNARFVAGIDPNPAACRYMEAFESSGIPIYPDLQSFYAESWADLVIISAPIHLHAPFTMTALAHGSHVLCEKPVAATLQEAQQMAAAAEKGVTPEGKPAIVGIGYQWSYAAAIQALKRDVMDGVLGRPLRLRTKVLWPRPASYYQRNTWAARLKTAGGQWILDSPAHNATAHYLHNCFYVLGETRETSAWPVDVQAELYRANSIENYDTAAIRSHTAQGTEILFYTSHPVFNNIGPIFTYEFENAVVRYDEDHRTGAIIAHFHDGQTKDYGNPFAGENDKLWQMLDAVRGGMFPACSIQGAMPQVVCTNGAQESMWNVTEFPENVVRYHDGPEADRLTWVEGLQETLEDCYDRGVLPSESEKVSWANVGKVIDLKDYRRFPMFH